MYRPPISDISHALKHGGGLETALSSPQFAELSPDLVDQVLQEAGRFAAEKIAPLDEVGDRQGVKLEDGSIATPEGWKELYAEWVAAGWNGLSASPDYGGQGLPHTVAIAALEMCNSSSLAFTLCPTLTMGAVEALQHHASETLQKTYLEKLVTGEWTGTMNLTEPQAGSDLAALKCKAERRDDGTYRLFGQKIYITFGEHDLAENIIHLVLARLPDAPEGTRGISLFLVPKFLPGDDGTPGMRNDVFCSGIEHKLGIHAAPTCTMIYGDGFADAEKKGAIGWLIGEENKGLACMFTMMNNARLAVGIEGVGIAEAAYQKALAYARERRQGKAPGWSGGGMSPIIEHPDIQHALLTMKAMTGAARAICYACAHATDMARGTKGDEALHWQERANLLTPVAKAFSTDIGVEAASIGIQVHGGMGFIEETGAARLLRDARIAPIYEGTNGIQAIDLVVRKLSQSQGSQIAGLIGELRSDLEALNEAEDMGRSAEHLADGVDRLETATSYLADRMADNDIAAMLAGATAYLRLFALTMGASLMVRGALSSAEPDRIALSRYFCETFLPETATLESRVRHGGETLTAARRVLA